MTPEEVIEAFEEYYRSEFVIRAGARGRASNNLERHKGEYISEHANLCFRVWCKGMQRALLYKNTGV